VMHDVEAPKHLQPDFWTGRHAESQLVDCTSDSQSQYSRRGCTTHRRAPSSLVPPLPLGIFRLLLRAATYPLTSVTSKYLWWVEIVHVHHPGAPRQGAAHPVPSLYLNLGPHCCCPKPSKPASATLRWPTSALYGDLSLAQQTAQPHLGGHFFYHTKYQISHQLQNSKKISININTSAQISIILYPFDTRGDL
jgi:hypothetical protein